MKAMYRISGLVAIGLLAGCGPAEDDWYDQSAYTDQRKDTYIRQQQEMGMSEEEAARQWGLEYSIEQTHGVTHPVLGTEDYTNP